MINGNDVLVLLRLAAHEEPWTFRGLGEELGMDPAVLHRGIARLGEANLVDEDRKVNRANAEEFLLHGVRYMLPGKLGPSGRGVPTAWGAEPLRRLLAPDAEFPVWPDPHGKHRGPVLEPIAEAAPRLARADPELLQWLALLDAVRVGRARERKLAADEIGKRIWSEQA
jgi:hypothetical protein